MKILTYIILGYLAYRLFYKRRRIGKTSQQTNHQNKNQWTKNTNPKDGDYIDYEEVD